MAQTITLTIDRHTFEEGIAAFQVNVAAKVAHNGYTVKTYGFTDGYEGWRGCLLRWEYKHGAGYDFGVLAAGIGFGPCTLRIERHNIPPQAVVDLLYHLIH